MGPADAVLAHVELEAQVSIAAHFRVFQLGFDGFDDAVNDLASVLKTRHLATRAFIIPLPGQPIDSPNMHLQQIFATAQEEDEK